MILWCCTKVVRSREVCSNTVRVTAATFLIFRSLSACSSIGLCKCISMILSSWISKLGSVKSKVSLLHPAFCEFYPGIAHTSFSILSHDGKSASSLQPLFTSIFLFSTCLTKERVLKLVGIHP
jgi:hypothetical protein